MQKTIDSDIKNYTKKLKELLAQKQGITVEQLEFKQKEKNMKSHNLANSTKSFIQKKKIDVKRFRDITYQFQCPNCEGRNTKRNGITTQLNQKARFLCVDCQLKKQQSDEIETPHFFTMGNEEMIYQIEKDKSITDEQKKLFIEKYIIKRTTKEFS